jgi:hypothetical protein
MKKVLIIISFLALMVPAQSQILITLLLGDKLNSDGLEFGLVGGVNWANISGLETQKYEHHWNLGFYFDIRMKEPWYLYTGVLVKSSMGVSKLSPTDLQYLGATVYTDDTEENAPLVGDYSQKMSYFLVPVLARYKFKNHLFVEAGPQFGLMYRSWVEFNSDIKGNDAVIKEYNRDLINVIDAGVSAGIGYTMLKGKGWTIGLNYYYGFVNVYKGNSATKNSAFFAKLHIPIGAGTSDEKEKK